MAVTVTDEAIYQSDFIRELVKQMRALDTYGVRDKSTPQALVQPFIVSATDRQSLSVAGDPGPEVLARLVGFFNTIALLIEKECGLAAKLFLNIDGAGAGTALVVVGKLVVTEKSLSGVQGFGFESLSRMKDEADKLLSVALNLIGKYSDVAGM
ncbi:MAG: DUF269 domain-containing protein [Magnetococcales bacterium]|nr:DUF269 domain-containing protein [Magnetococcales bacterium]